MIVDSHSCTISENTKNYVIKSVKYKRLCVVISEETEKDIVNKPFFLIARVNISHSKTSENSQMKLSYRN